MTMVIKRTAAECSGMETNVPERGESEANA